jgi:hypothetical protein
MGMSMPVRQHKKVDPKLQIGHAPGIQQHPAEGSLRAISSLLWSIQPARYRSGPQRKSIPRLPRPTRMAIRGHQMTRREKQ